MNRKNLGTVLSFLLADSRFQIPDWEGVTWSKILGVRIISLQITTTRKRKVLSQFCRKRLDYKNLIVGGIRQQPTVVRHFFNTTTEHESTKKMKKGFSGLQKDIFSLYRTILREAIKKDQQQYVTASSGTSTAGSTEPPISAPLHQPPRPWELWRDGHTTSYFARQEFRKQAGLVKRNDFKTIEHKIRHGYKQVKLLQMPGVKVVGRPLS